MRRPGKFLVAAPPPENPKEGILEGAFGNIAVQNGRGEVALRPDEGFVRKYEYDGHVEQEFREGHYAVELAYDQPWGFTARLEARATK